MNNRLTAATIAAQVWFLTNVFLSIFIIVLSVFVKDFRFFGFYIFLPFSMLSTLPVMFILWLAIAQLNKWVVTFKDKVTCFCIICFCCIIPYSFLGGSILALILESNNNHTFSYYLIQSFMVLNVCAFASIFIFFKNFKQYFSSSNKTKKMNQSQQQTENQMHENVETTDAFKSEKNSSNKILIKALIMGGLILLMLIPTVLVSNLIDEREARQKEVVNEVCSKWAKAQTFTGPYLCIPYTSKVKNVEGKEISVTKNIFVLPENLNVEAKMDPEVRLRSIYKVFLYKSNIVATGNFLFKFPKEMDLNNLILADAKICFNLKDFKGIEEKINVKFNNIIYEMTTGLPFTSKQIINRDQTHLVEPKKDVSSDPVYDDVVGLSAPVELQLGDLGKEINFSLNAKINGSERLHFIPLAGNSNFNLTSSWSDPKFDGTKVPNERNVSKNGFSAKWNFTKANLPFGTVLKNFDLQQESFAFGVSLLQPADQYAKTSRSVKYAILFIGLTFALFFVIELMQKKPVHPVQYILIGIALVIFFTLLLSISEFLLFDYAYLIASSATILLITFYAKSHFKSFKTASIFGLVLSCLYSFIFVLISLEDTALLVGSIGLFIVLALAMYGSRKINWYGQ